MDYLKVKKCEVCGKTKHISEFSKSYKNRCKTCVAKYAREIRATEKLKAKIKATGEIIDVEPSGSMQISCGSFMTKDGRRIPRTALEFEKNIDWEQRRYEIAKEMLHAIYLDDGNAERQDNSKLGFEFKSLQGSAKEAVRFADALIAELKEGGAE